MWSSAFTPGLQRCLMFRPSRSSNMVQVEIGLFSLKKKVGKKGFRKKVKKHLWDASSVSLMPSSQIWRVSLVRPSSPTLFIKPFASIWPSLQVINIKKMAQKCGPDLRRKTGLPSLSWPCQPPGKYSFTTSGSWKYSRCGKQIDLNLNKKSPIFRLNDAESGVQRLIR